MSEDRKEEIIISALNLASKVGLRAVSMSMIAEEVGIKKPSLYNHFRSKEEVFEAMYNYLRKNSQKKANVTADWDNIPPNVPANEILKVAVKNYIKINQNEEMTKFYKVIYSERALSKQAAGILIEETEKMIAATKKLLFALQEKSLLHFGNLQLSATTFAICVHGLMEFEMDKNFCDGQKFDDKFLCEYIDMFCKQHEVR